MAEIDKYVGSPLNEIPQEVIDNTPVDVYFGDYELSDSGRLVRRGQVDFVNNDPAPPDFSLYEPPPPNVISVPQGETVNLQKEIAEGNIVVGGGSSVDTETGLQRIEITPRYVREDEGTTGRRVSTDAPEEIPYDDDFEFETKGERYIGDDESESDAPVGLNRNPRSVTEVSNPKDAAGINGAQAVFDADLSEVAIEPRPNELNQYSSVTYNLALYMLNSKSYVNLLTAPSSPQAVLADSLLLMRSGGVGTAPENQTERDLGFFDGFYIDDLEFTSLGLNPNKLKQNTNATDIKFTIIEPRGVTLLEKLRDAAAFTLEGTKEKYIHAPYLLEIKFKGYDETGKPLTAPKPKYIPIKITDIKFEVTAAGTEYKVETIPFAHDLFGQIKSVIPMNVELTAGTIGNIFTDKASTFTRETETTRVEAGPPGTFSEEKKEVIKYGDSFKNLGEILTDYQRKRTQPTFKKSEQRTGHPGQGGGYVEIEIPPAAEKYDTYSFLIASEIANAKLNTDQLFDALDSPTPTGQQKNDGKANKSQFAAYAASFGGGVTIDKDKKSFKINAGTDITKLLNLVIMHSDYMDSNINELAERGVTDGKPIKWFKIKPMIKSATGPGQGFDGKEARYKYHIQYVVEPSVIYYHDFPWAAKSKPKGLGYHKVYDYIYTGLNTEVLDFKLQFRTAYMRTMTAGTGNPGADNSNEQDFGSLVKEQPQSPEGNTVNGADNVNRARAKDLFSSIMSDGYDMVELKLDIVGDPAYIHTSDAYWQDKLRAGKQYVDAYMPDGTINYELGPPYIQVNLRTPVDYDEISGLANVTTATTSSFSGIYKVTSVRSTFSGGQFVQKLEGFRSMIQPTKNGVSKSKVDGAGKERTAVTKETAQAQNPVQTPTPNNPDNEFAGLTNQRATVTPNNPDLEFAGIETAPYTSPLVNNRRTAEIARGPDETVDYVDNVNATAADDWNPPASFFKDEPIRL